MEGFDEIRCNREKRDGSRVKSDSCDVAASSSVIKGTVGVHSQFSSITSVGFFAMGLSGRICTETTEDVDT